MKLESANASATFSLSRGGRLASLVVFGHELLITAHEHVFGWGSFPMVPYAGRVNHGRFSFQGTDQTLPITMEPHAIHGTAWSQIWQQTGDGEMVTELVDPWPFGGQVVQRADLADDRLDLTLIVTAGDAAMPAMVGWHPWFRRHLLTGQEAALHFEAQSMYELDDAAIPTGELVAPPAGPWDNCFTDLTDGPSITWPDVVELTMSSTCTDWVIYDRPVHAICVEPQTGAPDAFNRNPIVLQPGEALEATFTMAWRDLSPGSVDA